MKRLGWIPIVLILLLVSLTGTAVIVGRALPAQPSDGLKTVGLDDCQGKVCLYQITPGVTTWTEAKQRLASSITRDEGDHFHGRVNSFEIRVVMDMTGTQIKMIDAQSSQYGYSGSSAAPLQLKQVIDQYGFPCAVTGVSQRGSSNGLLLVYPAFRLFVLADQDRIGLNSPISGITLQDDNNLDVGSRSCDKSSWGSPWRGFASIQVYQSLRQNDVPQYGGGYRYP